MMILEVLSYISIGSFFIVSTISITQFFIGMIRRLERELGNKIHNHVRSAIYHETQSAFPYETMFSAMNELSDIYLSRIRTSCTVIEKGYWTYAFFTLRSMMEDQVRDGPDEDSAYTVYNDPSHTRPTQPQ